MHQLNCNITHCKAVAVCSSVFLLFHSSFAPTSFSYSFIHRSFFQWICTLHSFFICNLHTSSWALTPRSRKKKHLLHARFYEYKVFFYCDVVVVWNKLALTIVPKKKTESRFYISFCLSNVLCFVC